MMKRLVYFLVMTGLTTSILADPPKPPEGFKWKIDDRFSDEFDGDKLNTKIWYDHHPHWKGRIPAKFVPENVSVKDGMLHLSNGMLDEADGPFTIGGSAVVSKSDKAYFGYYECRMKASSTSMSSTFWLSNYEGKQTKDGEVTLELDILETIGAPKVRKSFNKAMNSNVHYWLRRKGERKRKSYAVGNKAPTIPPTNKAFHTYGAWWVDANTIHFYLNNKHVGTVKPSTKFSSTPFDQTMHINMVTETYDWDAPPTPEEVNNPEINTTLVEWMRVYTLEADDGTLPEWRMKQIIGTLRDWKSADGKSVIRAKLLNVRFEKAFLEKANGKKVQVPIEKFCKEDRELLENIMRSL